jgi:hypothetical protein
MSASAAAQATGMKYLTGQQLKQALGEFKYDDIEFVQTDSIDENLIIEAIGEKSNDMFVVAAQVAIVGTGGRQYNNIKIKGEEIELRKYMAANNIKFDNSQQAKLEPGDITLRRLCRVYRHHIHTLLQHREDVTSYLFRKYTDQNPKYRTVCFPGAEHLVTEVNEAKYLYGAYKKLDEASAELGRPTKFVDRIERVFLARGIKFNKK